MNIDWVAVVQVKTESWHQNDETGEIHENPVTTAYNSVEFAICTPLTHVCLSITAKMN
jgi:hypothetical protein